MSLDYYFRDIHVDKLYAEFNEQIKSVQEKCVEMAAAIVVDSSLEEVKGLFIEELNAYFSNAVRAQDLEPYMIGTSTMNHFYWRTDNGFDGIKSVEEFMKSHPHAVICDEYDRQVSLDAFRKDVLRIGKSFKVKRESSSGCSTNSKPTLSSQIQSAESAVSSLLSHETKEISPSR